PLELWTFESPVALRAVAQGRYEPKQAGKATLYLDRADPSLAWAVDVHGRLVHGPLKSLQHALAKARSRQHTPAYESLARSAATLPLHAPAWVVADPGAAGVANLMAKLGD